MGNAPTCWQRAWALGVTWQILKRAPLFVKGLPQVVKAKCVARRRGKMAVVEIFIECKVGLYYKVIVDRSLYVGLLLRVYKYHRLSNWSTHV